MKVSEIRNKNSHHKWLTDRVTEDTAGYLKSDLRITVESFQTLIYNEIMGCITKGLHIYIVYCTSVLIMCLFICEQIEILEARFTSLLMSFFLSVNLLLWQEPWKKGKLVAPTLICASRVAPCHQTKRLIIKRIHAYFTLILRGLILNVVGHACS